MAKKPDDKNDDDDKDDVFSAEQRDELTKVINAAVGSHVTRKMPGMIKEAIDAGLAGLKDQLKPAGGEGGEGKPKTGEPTETERALAAKVDELTKKIKTLTDDTTTARQKEREAKRDAELTTALTAAGVDKNRMKGAIAVVRDVVKINDDGTMTWKAKRDGYEDDLEIAAGVKEWSGTDEGKAYLGQAGGQQQRGGGGTQRRQGASRVISGGNGGGDRQVDARQQKAEKRAQAMEKLATQVNGLLGNDGGGSVDIT